jgi:hypothetical protein
MREPSRLAIWRTAAIGGAAITWACIIDERLIVAFGFLVLVTLIFVGIIRDIDAHRTDLSKNWKEWPTE